MENTNKKYWKGIEELKNDIDVVKNADREFNLDDIEGGTYRRDFLKMLGFGVAAVSLAACNAPVRNAVPLLKKPEDLEPGVPNYYASTYSLGGQYCSILVKTREGRPIKIEGNRRSGVTKGGVNAQVHASLLSLYDNEKLKDPTKDNSKTTWDKLDAEVMAGLASASNLRIVTNTILSPTTKSVLADFQKKYPSTKVVTYDPSTATGLIEANAASFGKAAVPSYRFDKANVIVGINCDFLGTWISPIEFSAQWAEGRRLSSAKNGKKSMSRHYQFETNMSMTGANADYRGMFKPSQEGQVVAQLYNKILALTSKTAGIATTNVEVANLDKCAHDLVNAKGASLVVSGSNDVNVQILVNAINSVLGNLGNTIDFANTVNYKQGSDTEMKQFVAELKSGQVGGVIFLHCNPVYDFNGGEEIAEGLKKTKLSVAISERADETAGLCKYVALGTHYLESWGDANPKVGHYSLIQPVISNIFNSRQAESSLLKWAGLSTNYLAYLKNAWSGKLGTKTWEEALNDGVVETGSVASSGASFSGNVGAAAAAVSAIKSGDLELKVFENVTIGTGTQANNPWLQEAPDPVSKVTWENTASFSQKTANELKVDKGDWVKVTVNGASVELPVLIQPGQADGTVCIAMGYGRTAAGKAGNTGSAAYPLLKGAATSSNLWASGVKIEKTKSDYTLGQTQTHETYMGRVAVIQESVLKEFVKNPKAGRYEPMIATSDGLKKPYSISMWDGHLKQNHSWGMVIDLNTCTGCASCVVSCNAENNVSVVGKAEVARAREMHWLRIDRYYSSEADTTDHSFGGYKAMEIASANPDVVFQPMMCQHCSNAPCETVCPVLATTHSSEGLNQMTYNRCVGTRYCANNCPYKVRRFNWFKFFDNDNFDYHMNNELGRMVLNPDVTVRSRGVIEKCSMCVQRIQAGKLTAKKEKRRPIDGEIETACSQSCPTGAITFGDMLDPNSKISKLLKVENEGRAYQVLEEINVRPQVSYLAKIRNKDEVKKAGANEHVAHQEAEHAKH